MNGVFKKTLISTLSICLLSCSALAIENEYKNSLTKVELTKTGENSYNVNLYTQKNYSEPVKIIKKSDLNYYILLPETKNSSVQITSNNKDIRNISTNLYPYAGADSNNGYTKININTIKPIDFTVNTKTNQTAKTSVQKQTIASNTQKETSEVQKKNLNSSNTSNKTNLAPKIQQPSKAAQITNKLIEKKENIVKQTPKVLSKTKQNTAKKIEETKTQPQIAEKPQQQPKIEDIIQQEIEAEQKRIDEYNSTIESTEEITKEPTEDIIETEELNNYPVVDDNKFSKENIISILSSYKIKIQNKLTQYGLNLKELLLMILAGILSFFAMLFILNRKTDNPKLKNKVDLIDSDCYKKENNTPQKRENNGQYFVFDNNVKQTGFYKPSTSPKRNYELSSYDPDLVQNQQKVNIEKYQQKKPLIQNDTNNEYEIIQKILKEDNIIEFTPNEFQNPKSNTLTFERQIQTPIKKPIETTKNVKNPIKKEIAEPTVLSSIEIAPERGFMCVSYNNNINLVGYIFDDVFALHNFKQPKLANYDIKFRLSERTDKGATFIVKVENTKMLINVTKTSMNLEVVM